MGFTLKELIDATGAKVIAATDDVGLLEVSTDTRQIGTDMIYLPLKGETFDGADFIQAALDKGAEGYFTDDINNIYPDAEIILCVPDTKTAYLQIAEYYRNKISPKVIMITGSSGKTTVKEMMASVCEAKFVTHKTKLNHNNEIGLCQTFLSMPENTEVLVAEGGMRGLGEIELLSKYTKPDIAIITNVGTAHIGRLGSAENIAKAKCEIVKYLNKDGVLIAPNSDLIKKFNDFSGRTEYVDFSEIKITNQSDENTEFVFKGEEYSIPQSGEHNVQNASLVIEAAYELKMTKDEIQRGLTEYKSVGNRWQSIKIGKFRIINDCYNANPDSVRAAVKTFAETASSPKVIVLGNMGELGDNEVLYHRQIGEFIDNYKIDYLLTLGDLASNIRTENIPCKNFRDKKELAEFLKEIFADGADVLLKASRSMKFEEILKELTEICT